MAPPTFLSVAIPFSPFRPAQEHEKDPSRVQGASNNSKLRCSEREELIDGHHLVTCLVVQSATSALHGQPHILAVLYSKKCICAKLQNQFRHRDFGSTVRISLI